MAVVSSKWIEAISSLNELTQNKEITWEVARPLVVGIGLGSASAMYRARYKNRWFRLSVSNEPPTFGAVFGGQVTSPYLLEIVDEQGNSLFRIPESTGLKDLHQSIQFQLSGVDEILDSLLQERQKIRLK